MSVLRGHGTRARDVGKFLSATVVIRVSIIGRHLLFVERLTNAVCPGGWTWTRHVTRVCLNR